MAILRRGSSTVLLHKRRLPVMFRFLAIFDCRTTTEKPKRKRSAHDDQQIEIRTKDGHNTTSFSHPSAADLFSPSFIFYMDAPRYERSCANWSGGSPVRLYVMLPNLITATASWSLGRSGRPEAPSANGC